MGKFLDYGRGDGRLFNTVLRALGCTFICFLVVPLRVPFKLDFTNFLKHFRAKMENNLFDDLEVDLLGKIEDLILSGDDLGIDRFATEQLIRLGRNAPISRAVVEGLAKDEAAALLLPHIQHDRFNLQPGTRIFPAR